MHVEGLAGFDEGSPRVVPSLEVLGELLHQILRYRLDHLVPHLLQVFLQRTQQLPLQHHAHLLRLVYLVYLVKYRLAILPIVGDRLPFLLHFLQHLLLLPDALDQHLLKIVGVGEGILGVEFVSY